LGGVLEINADIDGTVLRATIPVSAGERKNADRPAVSSREFPSALSAD
jgi:hypothetical protein